MSPEPFEVGFFDDYEKALQLNKVILHAAHRRDLIEEQATKLVEDLNLQVKRDAGLLAEVAGLVEWPVALLGEIDSEFMVLPDEVLSTSMRSHQKYFSIIFKDGKLAPYFIVVANIESADGGAAIVAGNERVLRARLSDAKFFWDQDRKQPLETRVPALAQMIFHQKLGTLEDKVSRITALAAEIVEWLPGADRDLVRSAATLCKADLTTGMVGEFAELQGIMGRYYALEENEAPEVADAIAEHYSPLGPDDGCPTKPVSVAVSLADKIDTLVGFFGIDEKPTGSRDPFALRRAALGIIRIVLENDLRLPLTKILALAGSHYQNSGVTAFRPIDDISSDLLEFFADRLKIHLRGKGIRHDLVTAVFSLDNEDDLVRLVDRAEALQKFLQAENGENLLAAYRRATNIVTIEEKKDKRSYAEGVQPDLFIQPEEKTLYDELRAGSSAAAAEISSQNFSGAMEAMAALRVPVDAFFDTVTVNCDDPDHRVNRLNLLAQFRATLGQIADFGQIEG
jgi:glycyl-tRNA synthetase beta chain